MSEVQEQALNQITEIMREHFENAIIVVELEGEEIALDQLTYRTSGRWSSAIGLCEYAKHKLLTDPFA